MTATMAHIRTQSQQKVYEQEQESGLTSPSDNVVEDDTVKSPTLSVDEQDQIINLDLVPKIIQNETFFIQERYNIQEVIGRGSYGMVVSCFDVNTQTTVAIKKCAKVFPTGKEEEMLMQNRNQKMSKNALLRQTLIPKRILREMKILTHLNHPNIINLKSIIPPPSYGEFRDVYFITELMEADLRDFLVTEQKLSNRHVQYLMFQILSAIAYMHSADILHRDLKPENILVNSNCEIKICDFGLARALDFSEDPTMSTNYVVTRWYRSPELLLNHKTVSKAIDIWSVGCIMAELIGKGVLFKGSSPINQVEKILQVLGSQEMENVKGSPQGLEFINGLPKFKKQPLRNLFPQAHEDAIDLLEKMLEFNPEKRISALDALRHPYLSSLFDEKALLLARPFDSSFEDRITDLISIKREAFDTILDYAGIHRLAGTSPIVKHKTQEDREAELQKMRSAMMSPVVMAVQEDLKKVLENEEEEVISGDENKVVKKKKKSLFSRMKKLFKKTKKDKEPEVIAV
ncbi:mitogen-activated protein kinase [Acrasis kona]|uniref:Mitogen-activated protein kinase n=1 Tax=Acrasis kona TaxID=1008807 RepID=A0AAW2ZF52_9EUKA